MTLFELNNLSFHYQKQRAALSDINLTIHEGEILSLIGSNGSGKSTLLNLICGLVYPTQGSIAYKGLVFNEQTFKDATFNKRFRSSIGYIFQNSDAQLFCPTVIDELLFGPLQLGLSNEEARQRADEVMDMLCISELHDRPVYMLSGGEKKRVAIAAVLMSNPEVLIIDEPMSGLDPKTRSFLIELIYALNQAGKTIVLATHHLELVNHFQSRVVVLNEKHTIEKIGTCKEILSDTELLLGANLIGEYPHFHDGKMHKHVPTGFLYHQHNFVVDKNK